MTEMTQNAKDAWELVCYRNDRKAVLEKAQMATGMAMRSGLLSSCAIGNRMILWDFLKSRRYLTRVQADALFYWLAAEPERILYGRHKQNGMDTRLSDERLAEIWSGGSDKAPRGGETEARSDVCASGEADRGGGA